MNNVKYIDSLIIGAGPAGLQTGYFLKKLNIDYIILEKGESAGTFFTQYPISGKLISFNKQNTGSDNREFNLRFDWNSLLTEEEEIKNFTNYSDELFPHADQLVEYLNDFAKHLNIIYNCNVISIKKNINPLEYIVITNKDNYICKKLIIATGLVHKTIDSDEHLLYSNFNRKSNIDLNHFKNKKVCVIGGGNSAYELIDVLKNKISYTLLINNKTKLGMLTHYPGHLRCNYLYILDMFSLKLLSISLDINREFKLENIIKQNDKYEISLFNNHTITQNKNSFDNVIFCNGFKFDNSIFDFELELSEKLPKINYNYESSNNENLFFVGTIMHSLDYKKSSGSFIHGFRYLIKYMIECNYSSINTTIFDNKDILSEYIYKRLSICSSLQLMYDFMCDLIIIEDNKYIYFHDVTQEYVKHIVNKNTKYIIINMKYGEERTFDNFFDFTVKNISDGKYIHINITYFDEDDIFNYQAVENIFGVFDDLLYFDWIKRIINICI